MEGGDSSGVIGSTICAVSEVTKNVALKEVNLVSDQDAKEGPNDTNIEQHEENCWMTFNGPTISNHTKPLYLRANVNKKPLVKVLVNNGSVVKVIPLKILLLLGKSEDYIISMNLVVTKVNREAVKTLEVIPL